MIPIPLSFVYQTVQIGATATSQEYLIDIYIPPSAETSSAERPLPLCVFFHPGGLVAGSRQVNDWFPIWLLEESLAKGFIFVSADYTLLAPGNGFEMIRDVKSLFKYLSNTFPLELIRQRPGIVVDCENMVVAGTSAGGYMAYLSGIYAQPKPKGIYAAYAMGGQLLGDHYVRVKNGQFQHWVPYLTECELYQAVLETPSSAPRIVSTSVNDKLEPRVNLFSFLLQEGLFVDHLLGIPAFGQKLAEMPLSDRSAQLPSSVRPLFPSLNITPTFPPTFIIHGLSDSAVLAEESFNMHARMEEAKVPHVFKILEGEEHGWDFGKRESHEGQKDVVPFLLRCVGRM
ncbi:alpha/beta-hydrolase [Meredithblackwellia eburnea MCA 4105]